MTTWEYLVKSEEDLLDAFESLQDALDDRGSDGWELVGINKKGEYVFKRPKKA